MPVMKALLEKSRSILNLNSNTPDLPPTSSGPVFFHEFQMYCTSKQWNNFVEKGVSLKIYVNLCESMKSIKICNLELLLSLKVYENLLTSMKSL